ncbi:MAG: aldo/keto reductase [Pseudomonadales bacterium]
MSRSNNPKPGPSNQAGHPSRREFVKGGTLAGLGAGLLPTTASAQTPTAGTIEAYRSLGRTGLKISDISFGASRLRSGEETLVEHALGAGVNYFDTAESYTNGESERTLGRALKGKRDQAILASKQFAGASSGRQQMMSDLEGSLRRLQTEHIELYFNHAVNDVGRLQNDEWFEFVTLAKQQGKIGYTGISGHAGRLVPTLDFAIENALVDVVLVGYNFGQDPKFYESVTRSFDFVATQPDLPRALTQAKAKGIGVIAMKTLMGARLNDMRAYESQGNTFAQAAFRWTLSNADVDALIVSMTDTAQIDEYLGASGANELASGDLLLLREYAALNGASYCKHACNSCEGSCPYNVDIADVLRTRMYATDYGDLAFARSEYQGIANNAAACLGCDGQPCQSACPHGLSIDQLCAPTHRMLA